MMFAVEFQSLSTAHIKHVVIFVFLFQQANTKQTYICRWGRKFQIDTTSLAKDVYYNGERIEVILT